ncbi:mitochondrial glutathione transporter SLC25A39-like [Saccoglossus kowalevskii]|uniref:Solute carrier family 25 member 39-like n=1 Tax=Saccoglossus kowalevskii TaxID=10224 RepID=A0ABM0MW13_SACKO|nr:PREDICTED: solute carrier family 25 member 39-like [Saccoglossus kowalevskii]
MKITIQVTCTIFVCVLYTQDAFIKIGRNEGVTSLWSGLPPTLLMAVPATMIYFTAYDQLKMFLGFGRKNAAAVWWIPMSAGIIARIGAVSVINPLELIRTKMQSKALTYTELKNCVKTAIAQDGWLSLWRGLAPTLLRDVPFSAMYWTNYEIFKSVLCTRCELREPTLAISFASGAVSGMIAGVMTMPFDVVKTHRQTELGEKNIPGKQMPTSTLSIMKKIYRERGTRGLFAGMTPRIIRVAPACAIMISSYELMKSFFRKRNLRLLENG